MCSCCSVHMSVQESDGEIQCGHDVEVIGQYRTQIEKYGVLML